MAKLTAEMLEEAKRKEVAELPTDSVKDADSVREEYIKAVLTDDYITFAEGIIDGTIEMDPPSEKTYSQGKQEISEIYEDCIRIINAGNIKWSPSFIRSRLDVVDLDIIAIRTLFSREQALYAEFTSSKANAQQKKAAKAYHEKVLTEKANFDKLDAKYSDHAPIESLITQATTPHIGKK